MADTIYDPNALFGATSTQTNPDADNAPFTQVYGQRRSTPFSMDEYLSGSMYDFPGLNTGIDVSAAPDLDEDEKDKDQAAPNILTPVSERTDDPSSVFRAISQGGQLGTGYRVSAKDPSKYLDDLLSAETFTVKEDGFSKYAQQKFKEGGGIPTTVAGLAMGNPALTILGAGAAALAQKQNKKNAQAILQTGGGDLFELNGATVSRAPGERIFTGNLGGFSQEQLYASREMDFGFIPGSMRETIPIRTKELTGAGPTGIPGARGMTTRTGNRGVAAAGQVSGHIMDAYGTIHGTRDESGGQMQVGAIAAQRMRENEFRQNMIAAGLQSKLDEMIADRSFTMNAVRAKQHTDGIMKAGQGFRFRAANVPADQYAKALSDRGRTYQDYVKSTHGTTPTTGDGDGGTPPVKESAFDFNKPVGDLGFDDSDGDRYDSDPGGRDDSGREYGTESAFDNVSDTEGLDPDDYASGGRIGMAAGDTPQGTFEPGFVKGPPENFTERETVADDQNGKVKPDTFIINAAAVEIAGSEDIRKMLMKAYEVAVEKGLDIGRVDRKLYEGTVDVALSKGEVVVPPELAKIIGYDRLRKINNRGKKEVASRQKKAGGGFLDGKKYAKGDKVTVYRGEPLDPAGNQGVRTDYGYDQKYVGTHHTPDLRRAQSYANYGNQPGNRVIRSMKVTADEFFDGMQELIITNNQKARNNKSRMPISKKLDDDFSRFIESMRKRVLTGQISLDEITRNMIMNEAVFPNKKSKINFVETYKNDPKSAGKLVAKTISKLGRKAVPVIGAIETAYGMLAPSPLGDATLNPNIRFDDD